MKTIGIAVVRHQGKYLIGFRGPDQPLAGYAEFPGGKCEPGEEPAACTVRECQEETGLAVHAIRLLLRRQHSYPHGDVDLHFYLCQPVDVDAVRHNHQNYEWRTLAEMSALKFPEANQPLLELLPFAD